MGVLTRQKGARVPKADYDFYETAPHFAQFHVDKLMELYPNKGKPSILDVGMGKGVYGCSVRNSSLLTDSELHAVEIDYENRDIYADIYDKVWWGDFHQFKFGGKRYDYIIGNPPYSRLLETVIHGIDMLSPTGVLSFLLKASFGESETRFDNLYSIHAPVSVWLCGLRPIKGHAEMYGVFNFTKQPSKITTMHWNCVSKKRADFV